MAVVNPEVPQWLQPPSESERRRLELLEQQVAAKASSMLRKNVGMARMKEQAARLMQEGVMDEPTARKKALLDNADLIFADEPEALARLMQSEQTQAIQERSVAALERWREAQADRLTSEETYKPEITPMLNPVTGEQEAVFRSSRGSAQIVRPRSEAASSAKSPLGKLLDEREAAAIEGDEDAVKAYDSEIASRRKASKATIPPEVKQRVGTLQSQVNALHKQRLALGPKDDMYRSRRFKLAVEAANLQKQIDRLLLGEQPASEAAPTAPAPSGRVNVVSPNGKRGTIPADQLDEALREGYQRVE